ncbi:MAG TPA: hypothetical protein VMP08_25865, partial [Anaerolineae bacterium]|nr:hypothetical protein [Anaerolineae bacterium]
IGLLFLATAGYFMITYPLASQVCFDFSVRELIFTASFLLRRSRHVEWKVSFHQFSSLTLRPQLLGKRHVAQLRLQDGAELVMDFGRRTADAAQLIQRFAATTATDRPAAIGPGITTMSVADAVMTHEKMERQIRSWGVWLLIMGVLQMIDVRGLSPWGIVLLLVGAASFYFREAAMYVIYAVTIGWAGLLNFLNNTTTLWRGYAIVQFVIMIAIFWQFRQYRRAEKLATSASTDAALADAAADAAPAVPTRTQRWFPLFALVLGGVALLLFIAAIGSAFLLHNRALLPLITVSETLAVNMAVLGVATGLAGWLTIPFNKWVSIAGCLTGGLTLAAELLIPVILNAFL